MSKSWHEGPHIMVKSSSLIIMVNDKLIRHDYFWLTQVDTIVNNHEVWSKWSWSKQKQTAVFKAILRGSWGFPTYWQLHMLPIMLMLPKLFPDKCCPQAKARLSICHARCVQLKMPSCRLRLHKSETAKDAKFEFSHSADCIGIVAMLYHGKPEKKVMKTLCQAEWFVSNSTSYGPFGLETYDRKMADLEHVSLNFAPPSSGVLHKWRKTFHWIMLGRYGRPKFCSKIS